MEIVRSSLGVGQIILLRRTRDVNSRFIRVPRLRRPHGLALLWCLIDSTPGTVWVDLLPGDDRRQALLLHVFDLRDTRRGR